MELIKDYDLDVQYHSGKANVVANALSRKAYCNTVSVTNTSPELRREMDKLNLHLTSSGEHRH